MKTVGKQLQEARLAKNWTPELAARETKIKVDRLHDLESDDYSHFTSPTYARGFVRTYARSLGLDEYKILRQLDNKLPDDDSGGMATESGVAYLPETSMPPRAAHRDYTGLYIVMGLGAVVTLAIVFVLIEAYRVGELSSYFKSNSETAATGTTNAAPAISTADTDNRAKPIDSNTPPPIADAATGTNTANGTGGTPAIPEAAPAAPVAGGGAIPPRALPVDPSALSASAETNSAPVQAPRALPVDPSELTNAAPVTASAAQPVPPRALPVDPSELTNAASTTPPATTVAMNGTHGNSAAPALTSAAPETNKPLVLTASQDSFVRVTDLDAPQADKPLYAAVLHSGQSVGFDGRKFSINVANPSVIDIKLDGVNYGPHSDSAAPETFTVQSHLP